MDNEKHGITVTAELNQLHPVLQFVEDLLVDVECPMKLSTQIQLVVEELFVNVASYAYSPDTGDCEINVWLQQRTETQEGSMKLQICDRGKPFNPLEKEDPDITLSAEERRIGGLGILMVKRMMDQVDYEYTDNQNKLTIQKSW